MIEKYKSGNRKKYGVDWVMQNNKDKRREADEKMLEKYGVTNLFYSLEFQENIKKSLKKDRGVENPSQIQEIQDRIRKSIDEDYNGRPPSYNYCYKGEYFDSSWELAIWIYCEDFGIPLEREPVIFHFNHAGRPRSVVPDFSFDGRLVEVKGLQFFKDHDPTKRMVAPFTKKKVVDEWVPLTPEEKKRADDLSEAKHQCELYYGVEFWTYNECKKFLDYIDEKYGGREYLYKFIVSDDDKARIRKKKKMNERENNPNMRPKQPHVKAHRITNPEHLKNIESVVIDWSKQSDDSIDNILENNLQKGGSYVQ